MPHLAPNTPVADWRCVPQGYGYGNFYDPISNVWATVTRTTPKTARYYKADGTVGIRDVPAGYLALEPWAMHKTGGIGHAAVIEEARTNYLVNSYGAANDGSKWTTGWTTSAAAGSPFSIVTDAPYGSSGARIAYEYGATGGTMNQVSAAGSFAAGENAIVSAYVRGVTTGYRCEIHVVAQDSSGNVLGTSYGYSAELNTTSWVRVTSAYANLPANTSKVQVIFTRGYAHAGDSGYYDVAAVQLEKGAFATSYIPTTTAAVTRNADVIRIPTDGWSQAVGTWVLAVSRNDAANTNNPYLEWSDADTSDAIVARNTWYPDVRAMWMSAGGAASTSGFNRMFGVPFLYSLRYVSGDKLSLFFSGTKATTDATAKTPSGLGSTAGLGGSQYWAYTNGAIARATIYASALDDATLQGAPMTTDLLAGLDTARITNEVTL